VNLRTIVLPAVAAITLAAAGAGVATAQDVAPPDPQVVATDIQIACGTVTVALTNNDTGDYGFNYLTGPWNGGPAGDGGLIVVKAGETVTKTVHYDEDSFDGQGFLTLGVAYGPNTHKQVFVDRGPIDTDCETTTTTTTTTTAAPTTAPSTDDTEQADTTTAATPLVTPTTTPPAATSDATFSQVGEVPVGAIDTGRA
jgi:hypothetical protein